MRIKLIARFRFVHMHRMVTKHCVLLLFSYHYACQAGIQRMMQMNQMLSNNTNLTPFAVVSTIIRAEQLIFGHEFQSLPLMMIDSVSKPSLLYVD
jgi:hypothetical protein